MKIQFWDDEAKESRVRDATPEEIAQAEQDAADHPPPVDAIPMLNLMLLLIEDGHLSTVQGALTSMSGTEGDRARAYWERAQTARRDNELVNQLWPQLYEDEAAFNAAWARAAAMNP